jgi:hypothetical protein
VASVGWKVLLCPSYVSLEGLDSGGAGNGWDFRNFLGTTSSPITCPDKPGNPVVIRDSDGSRALG